MLRARSVRVAVYIVNAVSVHVQRSALLAVCTRSVINFGSSEIVDFPKSPLETKEIGPFLALIKVVFDKDQENVWYVKIRALEPEFFDPKVPC